MVNELFIILLTLLGFHDNGPKYDLHRKQTREDNINNIRVWIQVNFPFIALAVIIGLSVFFVWFCFFITGISATDSGMMYNNFDKVI